MNRIQLICEGERDARITMALIDRCLELRGLEPQAHRAWCRDGPNAFWTPQSLGNRLGPKRRAPVLRRKKALDVVALKAFLCQPDADLVLLLVDTDRGEPFSDWAREKAEENPQRWILANASPKIEAWGLYLSRQDATFRAAGVELKRRIGIDPVQHPHRTTPGRSIKEAKQVFEHDLGLTTDEVERLIASAPPDLLGAPDSVGLHDLWVQLDGWVASL